MLRTGNSKFKITNFKYFLNKNLKIGPACRRQELKIGNSSAKRWLVEEYSNWNEVGPARAGGLVGSKNVGMSSKNQGESP